MKRLRKAMTMISVNSELNFFCIRLSFFLWYNTVQKKKSAITEIHTPSLVLGTVGGGREKANDSFPLS